MLLCVSTSVAHARDCAEQLDFGGVGFTKEPSRAFYLCLLAEIDDLKRKQVELQAIVPEYKRLAAEVPVHFTNKNGEIDFEEGRVIGSASFILTARQLGGANSIMLDQNVLDGICPSPKGCSVTLTFRRYGIRGDEALETHKIGPCAFEIDTDSRCWICGTGCGSSISITGTDGDGSPTLQGSGANIIMEAGPGCVLADADVRRSISAEDQSFTTDHAPGLFLIADPSRRLDRAARFECSLELG
jgi:hypothetical protein